MRYTNLCFTYVVPCTAAETGRQSS